MTSKPSPPDSPPASDLFADALSAAPSPLLEADQASLDILTDERLADLFNKSPSDTLDSELQAMARYYRSKRTQFLQEEARKSSEPPRQRKTAKSVAEALELSQLLDAAKTGDLF